MTKITERLEDVRTRAIEMGVYLPLGAYAKVRDQISDLNRQRLQSLFRDLIDRGQVRLQPVERTVRRRGNDAQESARSTVKRTAKRAQAVAGAVAPRIPRVAVPKSASDLPISGYNSLTAADIVSRLQGLTQTELARVYKYEQANEDRSTNLEAIDSKLIDLPITTYDALTVDEIVSRLDKLSQKELKAIRRYEQDTKGRTTILDKLDSLVA